MISYRHADIADRFTKKPMVWMFNDNRLEKKFFNTVTEEVMDATGKPITAPVNMQIFERDGWVIILDNDLYDEHVRMSGVYRQSEYVGDIIDVDTSGKVVVQNPANTDDEGQTYMIDPLEYRMGMSPDHNKVGIKHEPVKS